MTSYNIAVTTSPCIFRPVVTTAEDLYKHAIYYDALIHMIKFQDVIFNGAGLESHQGDDLRHGQVGFVGLEQLQFNNTKKEAAYNPLDPEQNLLLQMERCRKEAAELPDDY